MLVGHINFLFLLFLSLSYFHNFPVTEASSLDQLICKTLQQLQTPKMTSPIYFKENEISPGKFKITLYEVQNEEKVVGELYFNVSENLLMIDDIHIDENFRGLGIQSHLYESILNKHPAITKIYSFVIAESNYYIFFESLLKELEVKNMAPSHVIREFENKFKNYQGPEDIIAQMQLFYQDCCGPQLAMRLPQEKEQILTKALQETPFMKTRKKLGFGTICAPEPTWVASAEEVYVTGITVCK